jgi:hypothetical protein
MVHKRVGSCARLILPRQRIRAQQPSRTRGEHLRLQWVIGAQQRRRTLEKKIFRAYVARARRARRAGAAPPGVLLPPSVARPTRTSAAVVWPERPRKVA